MRGCAVLAWRRAAPVIGSDWRAAAAGRRTGGRRQQRVAGRGRRREKQNAKQTEGLMGDRGRRLKKKK